LIAANAKKSQMQTSSFSFKVYTEKDDSVQFIDLIGLAEIGRQMVQSRLRPHQGMLTYDEDVQEPISLTIVFPEPYPPRQSAHIRAIINILIRSGGREIANG